MFGGCLVMNLSAVQQEIVDTPGNMIVCASAGTGKTFTMVEKIKKEINDNHTHKVIAAITFTVKAAKEIKDRIAISTSEHFIGTNNRFVIEEIITPFARDVYGNEFNCKMSTDYSTKFYEFEEGLQYLKVQKTIGSYYDNKKNFVFDLAFDIVRRSKVCRLYLMAKYFKVYIDEYQDCDKTMHEFFMYLCNVLHISLFVVGDDKQSIYIWRGAYPEAFKSITQMENFQKKRLYDNYRSCQQIQNYSNLLNADTCGLYQPLEDKSAIIYIKATSDTWVDSITSFLDVGRKTALLRYRKDNAKNGAKELEKTGTTFTFIPKTPITDITTDVAWLYNAIAQYFILPKYSIYDVMDEIPEESIDDRYISTFLRRKMNNIEKALSTEEYDTVYDEVEAIASRFGYTCSKDHITKMIDTIKDEQFHPAFYLDELKHVTMTFHSSKGLEYEQVIIFANDYPLANPESIYNHYVAVTRAKTKLIIIRTTDIDDNNGRTYCSNIKRLFGREGVNPQDVMTIV